MTYDPTQDITLNNNKAFKVKDTGGVGRVIGTVNTSNYTLLGDVNTQVIRMMNRVEVWGASGRGYYLDVRDTSGTNPVIELDGEFSRSIFSQNIANFLAGGQGIIVETGGSKPRVEARVRTRPHIWSVDSPGGGMRTDPTDGIFIVNNWEATSGGATTARYGGAFNAAFLKENNTNAYERLHAFYAHGMQSYGTVGGETGMFIGDLTGKQTSGNPTDLWGAHFRVESCSLDQKLIGLQVDLKNNYADYVSGHRLKEGLAVVGDPSGFKNDRAILVDGKWRIGLDLSDFRADSGAGAQLIRLAAGVGWETYIRVWENVYEGNMVQFIVRNSDQSLYVTDWAMRVPKWGTGSLPFFDDGMIWYETSTNTFKCRQGGVTRTIQTA